MNKSIAGSDLRISTKFSAPASKKICIVTGELAGPDFNGGIGITNKALAIALRKRGFDVDILYTQVHSGKPFSARGSFAQHVSDYRELGINLTCIRHAGEWDDWMAKSYLAMQHLLHHEYDLVFFDDTHGNAYYPLLARITGNPHLRSTKMCVTAHSATQWIYDLNYTPIRSIETFNQMEMERRSIELADIVKAPSAYILEKYRSYGWSVPANSIVLPNFVPTDVSGERARDRVGVNEIVFFGRLETRKGLWTFCRALDRLKYRLAGKTVTFLGKPVDENGISTQETILRRSARWPFEIRILADFDQQQALRYLKGPGRLAVMASVEDNSPSAILECLAEGIPFIACSGSGGEELLDEESRAVNLYAPSVMGLCQKLTKTLEEGAQVGRPSFTEKQLDESFSNWIERSLQPAPEPDALRRKSRSFPKPVVIVLVPERFDISQAVAAFEKLSASYNGEIEIEALTAEPEKLRRRLGDSALGNISVNDFQQFGKIARSLAYREQTVVAICHITQSLPPAWMERAQHCFAEPNGISALTGLASDDEEPQQAPSRETHFSPSEHIRNVRRYLLGNAKGVFTLTQSTNSGFVLMRSGVISDLARHSPVDPQYDRLKQMEDWIHELLMDLALSGKRFELVPDLVAGPILGEERFEVYGLSRVMRSAGRSMFAFDVGTDQELLVHLAIDSGLERERARSNAEYLKSVSDKIGRRTLHWNGVSQTEQMAMIAYAIGQAELAVDLNAATAFGKNMAGIPDLGGFIHAAAHSENLWTSIAANKYKRVNLDHDYSLQLHEHNRSIVLHANSPDRGMAALVFPELNLSKIRQFVSAISLSEKANPVRFRVELAGLRKSTHWSAEKVLRGGTAQEWRFDCPEEMRTDCRVILAVEMADPDYASTSAYASWTDPQFVWCE